MLLAGDTVDQREKNFAECVGEDKEVGVDADFIHA